MSATERTPLAVNVLTEYRPGERFTNCVSAFLEKEAFVDSHGVTRRILKVSAAVISAGAKVPFIPVSMKLGPILGPVSIACNGSGFFVLEYWAAQNTIDDFLSPKTQAQIELTQENRPGKGKICRNVIVISLASIFALSSQLTSALPGINYNEERFKVVAGIVLLVAGALTPMRSLQLSFNYLSLRCQGSVEAKVTEIKTKIAGLLLANQGIFVQQNRTGKAALIEEFEGIRSSQGSLIERRNQYVSCLLKDRSQPLTRTQEAVGRVFNYTGLAAGAFLAGVFEYVSGEYTFGASKTQLLDNDYLAGTLATLAVTSTAYLFATSIVRTTQRIFNTIGHTITGMETRNLGWQLRPKISFALTATGLLMDIFAAAPTFVILGDFYKDDNSTKRELLRDTTCVSLFLLLFTATLDIINDVITHSITKGSVEESQILALSREFQQFAHLIEKSPSREFIGYLTSMDEPTKTPLLTRINVSAEQLADIADQLQIT